MKFVFDASTVNKTLYRYEIGHYQPTRQYPPLTGEQRGIVDRFHQLSENRLFSANREPSEVSWLGHRVLKCPMDMVTYQEILTATRPT